MGILLQDLAGIGFKIFSQRVAALELHENKVRMLFEGSAVHQKFAALPAAYSGGICFAGMRENGQMRIYTDDSVQTSASFTLRERDRIDQLKPLLAEAEAKRELVRAAKEPPAWVVLEP